MTAPTIARLRALEALADLGEGGEAEVAAAILARLLKRHPELERELAAGPPVVDVDVPIGGPSDLILLGYLAPALGCEVFRYMRGKGSRSTRIIRGPAPMPKLASEFYAEDRAAAAAVARMSSHGYAIARYGAPAGDDEPKASPSPKASPEALAAALGAARATSRRAVHLQIGDDS